MRGRLADPGPLAVSDALPDGEAPDGPLPAPVDPAPLGWFLVALAYAFTALYSAVPAEGSTLFGAGPAGAARMAVALGVVPYIVAGLYTGLTDGGRGWPYPVTFAAWPILLERLALYLYGVGGQWMLAGFPEGWRQALPVGGALGFTRETLAPYATPGYVAWGAGSLAITLAVHAGARLVARRVGGRRAWRPGGGDPQAAGG